MTRDSREAACDAILIVVFITFIGAESLLYPFGRDQGIHAVIAYAMDAGRVPYLDSFNMKPPLTTIFHWVSQELFGHSMRSIRILDLLICQFIAVLIYFFTKRMFVKRFASVTAGIFFGLLYYSHDFWNTSQTDGWTSFFIVPAAFLLIADIKDNEWRPRPVKMVAAGVLTGFAFWLKYPVLLVGLLIFATRLLSPQRRRFFLSDALYFVLGVCIAMLSVVAFLAAFNAADAYFQIVLYIRQYVTIADWNFNSVLPLVILAGKSPVVGGLAVVGLFALVMSLRKEPADRYRAVIVLIWLCGGTISGLIQGKGFPYHYLPVVPPLSIVAAVGVSKLWKVMESNFPRVAAAPLATAILVIVLFVSWLPYSVNQAFSVFTGNVEIEKDYLKKFTRPSFDARDMRAVADYINSHSEPGDTLFLWGWSTGLYFMTRKPPISRFIYTWPLVASFSDGRYRSDLLRDLNQNAPDYFVVESGDATPHVLGHAKDSAETLGDFEMLQAFLNENYVREANVGSFTLFSKK
jgi:hypothetical protein